MTPMATVLWMHTYLLLLSIVVSSTQMNESNSDEPEEVNLHHIERRQACPDLSMCRSKWGHCGMGEEFCGDDCIAGPCSYGGSGNSSIITEQNFACAFYPIDDETRANRLNGLRSSGWKPLNTDEAVIFLAHVYHETDGLRTLREYCAPGEYSLITVSLKVFS
jgi:hypothetical protein